MGKISGVIQFTGKVGQVVGYGVGDRKKIRARADVVANPRTTLQCVQRMICATASGLITAFSDIYNNSAEGVAKGAPSLAFWRGVLMRALRTSNILTEPNGYIYAKRGAQFPVPNQLPLARGKLHGVNITSVEGQNFLVKGTGFAPDAVKTASEALADFGYTLGDQITIAILCGGDDEVYPRVLRFAFNDDTVPAFVAATGNPGFVLNEAALDLSKCAGAFDKVVFTADGNGTINVVNAVDGDFLFAAAIIVSRKEGQKRSNASFVVAQDVELPGFSAVSAVSSYAGAATPVESVSDVYLDNSTQEVTEPEPEPSPEPTGAHITAINFAGNALSRGTSRVALTSAQAESADISAFMADGLLTEEYTLRIMKPDESFEITFNFNSLGVATGEWDEVVSGSYAVQLINAQEVVVESWGYLVITVG